MWLADSRVWPGRQLSHLAWLRRDDPIETELVSGGCGFSVIEVAKRCVRVGAPAPAWVERVKIAAHMTDPRVAEIYDLSYVSDVIAIRRRFVSGVSLAQVQCDHATLCVHLAHAAEALEAMHDRGIAHGGLHGHNLVLSTDGIKLVDAGTSMRELVSLRRGDYRCPQPREDVEMLQRLFAERGVLVPPSETAAELRRHAEAALSTAQQAGA